MIFEKSKFLPLLVTHVVTLAVFLSGCGQVGQKTPVQESAPPVANPPVPLEYKFEDGTLQVYGTAPCSIKYKKPGEADIVEAMDNAKSGQVIYAKPYKHGKDTTGPDAIIEWTLKDGGYQSWIFSTCPKARVIGVLSTQAESLQIAKDNSDSLVTITVDDVFTNLGGARQVIVPLKFVWSRNTFQYVLQPRHRSLTIAELKAQAQIYKPLFSYFGEREGVAPPELSEAILRLYNEGDNDDAKKLLHYCWPTSLRGEEICLKNLQKELKEKVEDWKENRIVRKESK